MAPLIPYAIIKLRRDFQAEWERKNPVLREGEPGVERGTQRLKIGDGVTPWKLLDYVGSVGGEILPQNLVDHIFNENPHPEYDDGPSLFLLYENAKV